MVRVAEVNIVTLYDVPGLATAKERARASAQGLERALHEVSPQPLVRDEYAKVFIAASQDPYLAGVLANPGTSDD